MSKFTKKCMAIRTLSDTGSGRHTFLCNFDFLNRCISVKASLIITKLGNLVNLGVLSSGYVDQ